jgi:hypothetical protein
MLSRRAFLLGLAGTALAPTGLRLHVYRARLTLVLVPGGLGHWEVRP